MEEEPERHPLQQNREQEYSHPEPTGIDPTKRVHPQHPSDSQTDGETDEHLLQEIIRVRSQEKQKKTLAMWKLPNEELEGFFTNYQLYDGLGLQMKDLLLSKGLKLVKNESRVYFGEIREQKKHGVGTDVADVGIAIYQDGKVYEGQFQHNEKHGFGYEIYPNCNVYIGDFDKNKKHGRGTFYWFTVSNLSPTNHEEIEYYRGEWWGGLPSGQGVHRQSNGDICHGTFKNGLKHGEGHQQFSNGDSYHGEYVNGLPEGYGEYVWSDGSNYKGDFKQGVRNGFGIWKKNDQKNCEAYRGHYLLDRKSGYGVYIWENGEYYKGDFFQDVRHGYGEFYSNGALVYKGMWENGKEAPHLKGQKRKHHHLHQERQFRNNVSIVDLSEGDIQGQQDERAKSTTNHKRYNFGRNDEDRNEGKFEATLKRKSPTKETLATNKQMEGKHSSLNPEMQNTAPRHHGRVGHRNCIPVQHFGMPKHMYGGRK